MRDSLPESGVPAVAGTATPSHPPTAAAGVPARLAIPPARLASALGRLSPRQRRVVVLRFFALKTPDEIAAITGRSAADVRRTGEQALIDMRARLREDADPKHGAPAGDAAPDPVASAPPAATAARRTRGRSAAGPEGGGDRTDGRDGYLRPRIRTEIVRGRLVARAEIHRAVGMIQVARHCDAETALALLNRAAQEHEVSLRDLAHAMGRVTASDEPTARGTGVYAAARSLVNVPDRTHGTADEHHRGRR